MNVQRPNMYLRTFFKTKVNEFPENLRCSNINGAMHTLLVGECLTGAEASVNKNALVCIY